jgi:hypothetical protein
MATPTSYPSVDISAPAQAFNWFNFADPQILSIWIAIGFLLFLILKSIWDAYKDISGQRVIEQDGGILTISRVGNNAVVNKILTVAGRSYAVDHPPYRIVTRFGVHLTLWLADRVTGRTIGLNDAGFKNMSADEQNEVIRAIPEMMLGTVHAENNLTFVLLALGAGAFIGFLIKGFMG